MKRKLHIVVETRSRDAIRLADETGKIVCTLPRDEIRMAKFLTACVNYFGLGLRAYDRNDWLRERNSWRPSA